MTAMERAHNIVTELMSSKGMVEYMKAQGVLRVNKAMNIITLLRKDKELTTMEVKGVNMVVTMEVWRKAMEKKEKAKKRAELKKKIAELTKELEAV